MGLTIRKFPRRTTAVHELAAAIIFNSGVIHYADSIEVYRGLPDEVKQILTDAPAAWEQTLCLIGQPEKEVVFARKTGDRWFIAGINGTEKLMSVVVDLSLLGKMSEGLAVTEGEDPRMQFTVEKIIDTTVWKYQMVPFGGFVMELKLADERDNSVK